MITDNELRARLQAIAEWGRPATVPPPAESPVVELDRERARRRQIGATWWAAAAILIVMVVVLGTLGSSSTPPIASGSWSRMASAPIEPRALAASVWTGTEVVVVGGQTGQGEVLRDAAAYNPRTNTWRRLPDAPVDVHPGAVALWTGREVAVFDVGSTTVTEQPDGFFSTRMSEPVALDPATDTWRRLSPPPHFVQAATVVAGRIVGLAMDEEDPDMKPLILELEGEEWRVAARPDADGFDGFDGFDGIMIREWTGFTSGGRAVFLSGEWVEFNVDANTPIGFAYDPMARVGSEYRQPPLRARGKTPAFAKVRSAAAAAGFALTVGTTNDADNYAVYDAALLDLERQEWRSVDPPDELPTEEDLFRGMTFTTVDGDVVVLGGAPTGSIVGDGKGAVRAVYVSALGRWYDLPEPPLDLHRVGHSAVWTGSELVVWGGLFNRTGAANRGDTPAPDGATYRP